MATVQRRLGVILCTDIVGHGAPSDADDSGAPTALKAHREATDPLFLQEGGRFVKDAGLGQVLEFPSAFNAMRASLGVQRLMAERNAELPVDERVVLRMGIHLGDVVIEDEDISGDGINVAERLQEIAHPGGICLSRAAHAAIHKDFDSLFPDGGTKALKDIDAPVHVYNLAPEAAMLPFVPAMTVPRRLLPLVVLPFANMTSEARHDFLADSITDQLTSELARIEDSFVVDRKTALAAAVETTDVAELAASLAVRYVIRGGLSAGEAGLRIDAALVDAETAQEVWTDRLDIAIGDPFVMQHEANARLIPLLYARLLAASGHRPQMAPAPIFRPAPPPLPAPAPQPVAAVEGGDAPWAARATEPQAVGWAGPLPAAQRQVAPVPEGQEVPWASPPAQGQMAPRAVPQARPAQSQIPEALAALDEVAPQRPSALAVLASRWPVLRRPAPRLSVGPGPTPAPAARPAEGAAPEAPVVQPLVPPMVLRPRVILAPVPAPGRLIEFRRPVAVAKDTSTMPGPYTAQIFELPTPPLSERPESWRIPLVLRILLVLAVAVVAGAIGVVLIGVERDTIVEIVSWALVGAGLAQLAMVFVERFRPETAPGPAQPVPVPTIRADRDRPKPAAAEILRVRAVRRSPQDISDNRRRAP